MKLYEIKSDLTKNIDFIDMKISAITSTKHYSYSEQSQKNFLIFWTTNRWSHEIATSKITWKSFYTSKFTKHTPSLNLEEDTLPQIQKWWYAITSAFFQSLSTINSRKTYKSLKGKNYDLLNKTSHHTLIQSQTQQKKTIRNS